MLSLNLRPTPLQPKPTWVTRAVLSLLFLAGFSAPALAVNNFYITAESPGVQQSSLYLNPAAYGATNVIQDSFDYLKPGYYPKGVPFDGNPQLGSYSPVGIQLANQYGGATGNGNYFTVAAPFSSTSTTLDLTNPQRYFGFWLSALDRNNQLSFYSKMQLVGTFSAADVLKFINQQPNARQYFGNPNPNFAKRNTSEPYAFLNFFANPGNPAVTFDRIVFSNSNSRNTGFEADNFTIASSYTRTSGKPISVPFKPSSTLGLVILMFGFAARSLVQRSWKQYGFEASAFGSASVQKEKN